MIRCHWVASRFILSWLGATIPVPIPIAIPAGWLVHLRHPKFRLCSGAKSTSKSTPASSLPHRNHCPTITTSTIMAPKRLGGSRRSYNPITGVYNAFVVSENAPIVRSVTAFGVSLLLLPVAHFSLLT